MRRSGWVRAGLILLWLAGAAAAQKLPLSMKQAVDLALEPEGSIRVQLAAEAIRQAESQKGQARAALLPHVDGVLRWEQRVVNLEAFGVKFGIPGSPLETPSKVGPFNVVDARARGTQTVFSLAAIRRYQASKAGVRAARAAEEGTRDRVAGEVAIAYLAALRANARLEAARANVTLAEELLELAENQKAAGTGTGIDITRAKVQLQNEKQLLLVANNDRRRAVLELLRAMDLRLQADVELTDRLEYHPIEAPGAEAALKTALTSRGDWKAQQRREDRARISYSAVKWERLPSAGLYGDYGTIGSGATSAFPTYTAGIQITVPVFDGGRMDQRRAETGSLLRQERIRSADLRTRIDLEIRLALDSLHSADQQVAVSREGRKLAENELAQARRRFKAGVANSVEVTDAQNRVARARDNEIAALYGYESARLQLGTAMGRVREYIQ